MNYSYYKIPYFERFKICKTTNKLYLRNKICKNRKVIALSLMTDGDAKEIPIKKVRTKSVILKDPVKAGELIMIGYETWKLCRSVTIKTDDIPLVNDGLISIEIVR